MSLPEYDLDSVEENNNTGYEPGEYFFEVTNAVEHEGPKGMCTKATLRFEGPNDFSKDVYFSYSSKALFKILEFIAATGIEKPTEHEHFIGAKGKAMMVKPEGSKYLDVDRFISMNEAVESPEKKTFEVNSDTKKEIDSLPF